MIKSYKFKSIIYPNLFGSWYKGFVCTQKSKSIFAIGNGKNYMWGYDNYSSPETYFSWNLDLWKNTKISFERVIEGKYNCIFCKNSWKNRDFRNRNLNNCLIKTSKPGKVGYINPNIVEYLCEIHIKNKKKLVLIDDLVSFNLPEHIKNSNYIIKITMKNYLNVKYLLNIYNFADNLITACTSPLDLALYYNKINTIIINCRRASADAIVKWIKEIHKINNTKYMIYNNNSNNEEMKKLLFN